MSSVASRLPEPEPLPSLIRRLDSNRDNIVFDYGDFSIDFRPGKLRIVSKRGACIQGREPRHIYFAMPCFGSIAAERSGAWWRNGFRPG